MPALLSSELVKKNADLINSFYYNNLELSDPFNKNVNRPKKKLSASAVTSVKQGDANVNLPITVQATLALTDPAYAIVKNPDVYPNPDNPKNISLTSAGFGSVRLAWTSPTYSGKGVFQGYKIITLPGNTITRTLSTTVTITGLSGGINYTFNISAVAEQGESGPAPSPSILPSLTTFTFNGSYQFFTVPAGVTSVNVLLWGAAGGGTAGYQTTYGGGGASVKGTYAVTPGETLRIIVGRGGKSNEGGTFVVTDAWGGGGAGYNNNRGSGGGRSAIQRFVSGSYTDSVVAGGGGGGGWRSNGDGGGGGVSVGWSSTGYGSFVQGTGVNYFNRMGGGGSQTQGGDGGSSSEYGPLVSGSGTKGTGGSFVVASPGPGGPGGGGGWYGGGAGCSYMDSNSNGSGGGGSSYMGNLTDATGYDADSAIAGVRGAAGNRSDPYYNGYGRCIDYSVDSTHGAVLIYYV